MNRKYNILVTGCGGDIGQSIGKILNESYLTNELHGCDISGKNAAQFIFRNFFIGLPYHHEDYLAVLEAYIQKNEIDLVIPIAEPELRYFSQVSMLDRIGRAIMVTASPGALKIGFDKLLTANFLKEADLPFPETHELQNISLPSKLPVIIKSRTGSGSSKVHLVEDVEHFQFLKSRYKDYILQEFLDADNGEYTCGVFRSRKGIIRTIVMKRELLGGFSGYGEVIENREVDDLLVKLATLLNLEGSINVQLRLTDKGPVVFEINPRFSSTVRFRDMLGFKDVQWSIEDKLGLELSEYHNKAIGRKFYKGFNEYIS